MGQQRSFNGPFQDPKLEVPTIYKAYIYQASISGNIPTIHMAKYYGTVVQYLHVLDPESLKISH